jgi:putative inorganic carbon (HCO3(-)) transporter
MFVLLILAAFLFLSPYARKRLWIWVSCALVIGIALLLGYTRSIIWVATPAAGLYLLWSWNRRALLAVPVAATLIFAFGPAPIRERFTSMFQPRKEVDSNQHRIVSWRTGLRMIAADPWFGLGPEEVKRRFDEFVPPDVARPLPSGWYGHLHNIYLHYAAERGLPAMLALVWLLLQTLWDFLRELRKLPPGRDDLRFILHGGVAVVIATMIAGLFELNLGDSEVLTMFLVVVSCGYVAVDELRAETAVIPAAA